MTDGDRPPASNDPGPSSYTNPLISGEPPFPQVSSPYEEQLMSGASSLPAYDDGAAPAAGPGARMPPRPGFTRRWRAAWPNGWA